MNRTDKMSFPKKIENPENVSTSRQGKKNLRRGKKVEIEPRLATVFDNEGFEEERHGQTKKMSEKHMQSNAKSKENRILPNLPSCNPAQERNSTIENVELKEKNVNVRQSQIALDAFQKSPNKDSTKRQEPSTDHRTGLTANLPQKANDVTQNAGAKPMPSGIGRFRSTSLTIGLLQRGFKTDGGHLPFSRSYSMRVSSKDASQIPRRRLLREMSLSDSDDVITKDYGSLDKVQMPCRLSESEIPNQSSTSILVATIQALIDRGKVSQLMVIDLLSHDVIASLPKVHLSQSDAIGMVKSLVCSPTIFRLTICDNVFTCFKHSQNSVQGRSGQVVLVMQRTRTCLIVALSHEDAPGACQSEVQEFSRILENANW